MFFEQSVQGSSIFLVAGALIRAEIIEDYLPGQSSMEALQNILTLCGSLVEELNLRQLLPPLDVCWTLVP